MISLPVELGEGIENEAAAETRARYVSLIANVPTDIIALARRSSDVIEKSSMERRRASRCDKQPFVPFQLMKLGYT